jgi:hypothetical protein
MNVKYRIYILEKDMDSEMKLGQEFQEHQFAHAKLFAHMLCNKMESGGTIRVVLCYHNNPVRDVYIIKHK